MAMIWMLANHDVTGATGFIGRRLANALADDGWHVRALVREGQAGGLPNAGSNWSREVPRRRVAPRRGATASRSRPIPPLCTYGIRGGKGDFEERERQGRAQLRRDGPAGGVERVVYLGGPRRLAVLEAPAQPGADRGDPATARALAYLFPGGHGGGARSESIGRFVICPAAAGDDRAVMALDADPADRGRRRDRLSEQGARPA